MDPDSSQNSAIQGLIVQNQKLRELFDETRKEKQEAQRLARKFQGELKANQFKMQTIQAEMQKIINDNRRFMELLEAQKRQKIKFLTEASEAKNLVTRKDTQIISLRSQNDNLIAECNRLKDEIQNSNNKNVLTLKDRQNTANTTKVLETKLEAAEISKKYLQTKVEQLQSECSRMKSDLDQLTKKYHSKQIGVEAIYRDEEKTKEKLLGQFQRKISIKDQQMKQQLQKFMNENSLLKQQIVELQSVLRK